MKALIVTIEFHFAQFAHFLSNYVVFMLAKKKVLMECPIPLPEASFHSQSMEEDAHNIYMAFQRIFTLWIYHGMKVG